MSDAVKGAGTTLAMGDAASPEAFSTIFEVVSISAFGATKNLIDVTHLSSVGMEYIVSLPDGVEMSLTVNYKGSNSTHAALMTDMESGATRNFRLTLNGTGGGRTFTFAALAKDWGIPTIAPNDAIQNTFTLKVTGPIVRV